MKVEPGTSTSTETAPVIRVIVKEDLGLLAVRAKRLAEEIEDLREQVAEKEFELGTRIIH